MKTQADKLLNYSSKDVRALMDILKQDYNIIVVHHNPVKTKTGLGIINCNRKVIKRNGRQR